jgi:predicted phosphodiesterase
MKLQVLSDLHLSCGALDAPRSDADVVVLAGDVARPREAIAWASGLGKPVVFVAGNHEFYGGSLDGTPRELRREAAGTGVRVLDCDEAFIGGVRFLGATLWTDFLLHGAGEGREAAVREALLRVRDFTRIRTAEGAPAPFMPDDSARLFHAQAAWLDRKLSEPHDGPTVVVTHHAPSPRSIHPRFAGSPLNACFVSDAEHLLAGGRAALWVHGHTHDSHDYDCGGTRVVCNPRGYSRDGANENPRFDAAFQVRVG